MKKTGIKWSILSQDSVKTTLGTALLSVIMDVVAKEERKGDKVFDGGEGVQMDLKIADLPRQFQSLTGHFH